MQRYIAQRLLGIVLNLFLVTLVIFFALRLVPSNIAAEVLGQNATPEQYDAFNAKYGLDDPAWEQFTRTILHHQNSAPKSAPRKGSVPVSH